MQHLDDIAGIDLPGVLRSVAWKVNEDQLAAVNILPSDGSKTIVIQDVLSTLAGRASRSSPGTVVTADRLEDSVERYNTVISSIF